MLAALLACGGTASAHAASTPARLTDGEHSIERLLHIPVDVPPGRYTVQCEAFVDKPGRARYFKCYSREGVPLSLESAVIKAVGRASFIPATRDDVPVAVSMLIMVRIDVTAEGPLVLVLPNNGIEASRYGLFYTAPQWFKGFNLGHHWNLVDAINAWVLLKLSIDEHGKIVAHEVINDSGAPSWMVDKVEEGIEHMEFLPGLFNGKPVPMEYVKPIHWRAERNRN